MAISALLLHRNAKDEAPFRRQEALQADRQGQGPRPSRVHQPHPREEVAEAEAAAREAGADLRSRRPAREEAVGGGQVTRVKRSVAARKKRREVLEQTRGFRGQANHNYRRAKEAL